MEQLLVELQTAKVNFKRHDYVLNVFASRCWMCHIIMHKIYHYAQDISLHDSYIIQVSRQQDWAISNDLQDNERGDLSQRQFELSLSACAFSQLSSAWLTWHSSYLGEKVLPCSYMRMKYSGIKVWRLTFNKEPGHDPLHILHSSYPTWVIDPLFPLVQETGATGPLQCSFPCFCFAVAFVASKGSVAE